MGSRRLTQRSQSKRLKTLDSNSYLHSMLRESGLTVNYPPERCIASEEIINVIRKIKKNLENHFNYPRNVSDIFLNLESECKDLNVFKHYLFPNISIQRSSVSADTPNEVLVSDSVIKILLSVPILQNKLSDYIFEKAKNLAAESNCGPWIQMILKCFSSLDNIVDTNKMSTNLINLLEIATEKVVRLEIITAIPDIIGDQEHDNIAAELSRILSEDHDLIPAILECLSYLCLSDEQYEQLQKKTLSILTSLSKCNYFPNFVKFLLLPSHLSDSSCLDTVHSLRNALGWPTASSQPQEIATSQVLTATALRNSMVSSKVISNSWIKAISSCKVYTDFKSIDLILLLILFSTLEEKQKQVENLIRKQIKLNILTENVLDDAFKKFKPILKEYLKNLIELANSLLKIKADLAVESFASHLYTLMFTELEDCCQTIVAELLQLGLDSKQCVMSILIILNNIACRDMSLLKPQSLQMLTLLDRMDDMTLNEVRAIMNLLCGLAYSYENSVIRDDIHMIIRKELGSSNPTIKVQGILAAIHAVKYLMITKTNDDDDQTRELPHDVSYGSVNYLSEGNLREAAQVIELISRSTRQFPEMIAFFYDELSEIISLASYINIHFLSWLTDAVTNDLQQNFIVDSIEVDKIGELELTMQYCLNTDSEIDEIIAINIAGLTLNPNADMCIAILSSLFQLIQRLHSKQYNGNLASIDALLGCSVVIPKFDVDMIEELDNSIICNILDCLIHCINWFRELVNAFSSQNDNGLKSKTLKRVMQIEELEILIKTILFRSKISYKPPICSFNLNKCYSEYTERKLIKAQNTKHKVHKKLGQEDIALPETSRSQMTQNNVAVKNSLDISQNLPLRQLSLNILHLVNTDIAETDKETEAELTVKTLNFLLKCVNSNIEKILMSKIKKKTFLSKQKHEIYDSKKAEECAKLICEILPKLVDHLKFVTSYIDKEIDIHDESETIYTVEVINYITCLELIYNVCTIYFKWIGFRNYQHNALLKSSLRTMANSNATILSLKDLLTAAALSLQKHERYCRQLSTAISLIELLKSLESYSDNRVVLNILRNMAQKFLTQEWKSFDGIREKGLYYNQIVDRLASIYLMNYEILALKNLTLELTQEIKLLKTSNNTLNTLKCINKGNFPILYRNLGTALYDATKLLLEKGMTNSEHLELWNDVATIMKNMLDICKILENRNNLSAFFKKSLPVLKLFLSQGIPILEIQFKNNTEEVLKILKILQKSTRFLQTLCCHSRLKKDTVLMSKVPYMRQLLETLIYKVKAVLAANNCSEAFWMGNLKNRDIHGEVISTQKSIENEESVDDCDEQLPEDSDGDSEDEILNPDSKSISDIV